MGASVLSIISVLIGFSTANSLNIPTLELFTQSGQAFSVNPVKVTSTEDNPLLMFYMINSSLKPRIEVLMDTDFTASFDYSIVCASRSVSFQLSVSIQEEDTLALNGESEFRISCENATESEIELPNPSTDSEEIGQASKEPVLREIFIADGQVDVNLRSGIIGYADVKFSLQKVSSGSSGATSYNETNTASKPGNTSSFIILDPEKSYKTLTYTISIIRKVRPVDKLFRVIVYAVQIFVATGFGAKLDLQVVKDNLWRPVAPGIGLVCQYLIMPLVGKQ